MLTAIPFLFFGGLDIANDISVTNDKINQQYHNVIAQQQTDSQAALLNFDLVEAELVVTRISQLDFIVSATLDSYRYGMQMAQIINSDSSEGVPLYYPIFDDQSVQIGQLIVVRDYSAYDEQMMNTIISRVTVFVLILCGVSLLFSRALTSALQQPFAELQQFALQITKGDYQTPTKSVAYFVEISNIFRALETMRCKLKDSISKLTQSEERYSRTYNLTQVCMFVVNIKHGRVIRSNRQFSHVILQIPNDRQQETLQRFLTQLTEAKSNNSFRYSLPIGNKERHFQVNISDPYQDEIECSALDITELVMAKQAVESQLVTDVLTQIPNRYCFNQFAAKANNGSIADITVLMIDLNGFKKINDTYGHAAGDHLLIEIAARIKHQLRSINQSVFRLGGDEFVVTVEGSFDSEIIQDLATRLKATCAVPIEYKDASFQVSLSIGIEHFSRNNDLCIERCLNTADAAMYHAKSSQTGIVYASDLAEKAC